MEFIFELFAEILGRADDSIMDSTPADGTSGKAEAALQERECEPTAEPSIQDVNIFNVVNFH